MDGTLGQPRKSPDRLRKTQCLTLSGGTLRVLRAEAERRDISMGRLAEQWIKVGIAHDAELAHLSAETGTFRAS